MYCIARDRHHLLNSLRDCVDNWILRAGDAVLAVLMHRPTTRKIEGRFSGPNRPG
jgi:hypothetical protein